MPITGTRTAFSVLELMIATSIFASVAMISALALRGAATMSETVAYKAKVTDDAQRIVHDIAEELRSADTDWIYALDDSNPDLLRLSYQVCTGFDTLGNPIYDLGDYKREVLWDTVNNTLTKIHSDDDINTPDHLILLTKHVAPGGFEVNKLTGGTTVEGNRLQLSLTLALTDSEGHTMTQNAMRTIYLRSSSYGSDGIDASTENDPPIVNEDDSLGDAGGEDNSNTIVPPKDIHEAGGPKIVWGQNQGGAGKILMVVALNALTGTELDSANCAVELAAAGLTQSSTTLWKWDSGATITVSYGWSSPAPKGVAKNEIKFEGALSAALAITVTGVSRTAKSSTITGGTTRETNWY